MATFVLESMLDRDLGGNSWIAMVNPGQVDSLCLQIHVGSQFQLPDYEHESLRSDGT